MSSAVSQTISVWVPSGTSPDNLPTGMSPGTFPGIPPVGTAPGIPLVIQPEISPGTPPEILSRILPDMTAETKDSSKSFLQDFFGDSSNRDKPGFIHDYLWGFL